ncbi:MAG: sigma-54-dependent Fis family transcriptional regulator [Oscillochloridaceae bacterium umkhey_bin13]
MSTLPAPPILRSLRRCQGYDLAMESYPPPAPALTAAHQQLLALARPNIEDLYQLIDRPGFAVLLADAAAVAIDLEGDAELVQLAQVAGLVPPVQLDERVAGTNAIDLALREAQPVQTAGDEHHLACLRSLALAAAPIFAAGGQPVGALAIITQAKAAHPHSLGLAIAAAQALHQQLRSDQLLSEANDQLAELYASLEAISEGLIFVGPGGEIRRINSRAAGLLGMSVRTASGRLLDSLLSVPPLVATALTRCAELIEQEIFWPTKHGSLGLICAVRPVWDPGRRYLGALISLRPPQSIHQLVRRVVGAEARFTFSDVIGQSAAMRQALRQAHLAANATGGLLLHGEPGVGKEIFAQAIHNASTRAGGPFVGLNCAAVPRPLLADELFGIEGDPLRPGQLGRPGKLELAQGGVLYLEDVGALPPELQTALLRAIEMRRIMRSGGRRPLPIDVRVFATAGPDLERQVKEGRFRGDLLARLSSLEVHIPPLREREDDLLLLINHLLQLIGEREGRQVAVAPDALQVLRAYAWPGNVRELELVLERTLAGSEKSVISRDDLPVSMALLATPLAGVPTPRLDESNHLSEREAILRAGRQAGGHLGRTATLLGISRATLWRKMVRYGLSRDTF